MRARSTFLSPFQCWPHRTVNVLLLLLTASERGKGNLIFAFCKDLSINERIGIANLNIFRVNRFNMERMSFLSVSYQNKKMNDFFVPASPYSYCIAPVPPVFAVRNRLNRLTPGLTM